MAVSLKQLTTPSRSQTKKYTRRRGRTDTIGNMDNAAWCQMQWSNAPDWNRVDRRSRKGDEQCKKQEAGSARPQKKTVSGLECAARGAATADVWRHNRVKCAGRGARAVHQRYDTKAQTAKFSTGAGPIRSMIRSAAGK